MIIRARAPLRLGIAGGGSDVSPYSDIYGGHVLNATIDKYAHCNIVPTTDGKIKFIAADLEQEIEFETALTLEHSDKLPLHVGAYNRIIRQFGIKEPLSFTMITYSDAPAGSGLGSSSTMMVAILKAYEEWLDLPLGEYDLAHLAFEIERIDLGLAGGKQDQYAAAFGGFNFIEFYGDDKVIVNPLRIKNWIEYEFETRLVLFFTGKSRESANIIKEQIANTNENLESSMLATHAVKESAMQMKEAILKGQFQLVSQIFNSAWSAKKKMANSISNRGIDDIVDFVLNNGADAVKVSGAGGGGFMMILCDPLKRPHLINQLNTKDGFVLEVKFVQHGAESWIITKE